MASLARGAILATRATATDQREGLEALKAQVHEARDDRPPADGRPRAFLVGTLSGAGEVAKALLWGKGAGGANEQR